MLRHMKTTSRYSDEDPRVVGLLIPVRRRALSLEKLALFPLDPPSFRAPLDRMMIEASLDRRLYHHEIGRNVEVARREQGIVPNVREFVRPFQAKRNHTGLFSGDILDARQNRIVDRLEGLRDERRANRPSGRAGAERDHPSQTTGDRWRRQQIAQEIKRISQVISQSDTMHGEIRDDPNFVGAEPDRPADACVRARIFRGRRGEHAMLNISLDQNMRFTRWLAPARNRPDIKRRVGPARLREIFDRRRDAGVARDKNDVARPQRAQEGAWIGGRQRHKVFYGLSQVAREPAAEPLGDPISEARIRGQYHRQNPRKATNSASAGLSAGLITTRMGQPAPERRLVALDDPATSEFPGRPVSEGLHKLRDAIVVGLFEERLVDGHRIVARARAEWLRHAADDDLGEDLIGRCALRALAAAARPEDDAVDSRPDRSAGAADTGQSLCEGARKLLGDPPRGRITRLGAQRSHVDADATERGARLRKRAAEDDYGRKNKGAEHSAALDLEFGHRLNL